MSTKVTGQEIRAILKAEQEHKKARRTNQAADAAVVQEEYRRAMEAMVRFFSEGA